MYIKNTPILQAKKIHFVLFLYIKCPAYEKEFGLVSLGERGYWQNIQNRAIKGGSMELSEPWKVQLIKVSDWRKPPSITLKADKSNFFTALAALLDSKIAGAGELVIGPEMFNIKITDTELNFQIRSPYDLTM